jgi:hypothetical protein
MQFFEIWLQTQKKLYIFDIIVFVCFFRCDSYSLTLVDALDTLAIMGNHSEFQRVAKLLESTLNFDKDINVSVFETNIRGRFLKKSVMDRLMKNLY